MKNNNVSGSRRARGQRILSGRRKRLIKQRAITILPSALLALFFLGVTALICTKIPDPAARTATSVTVALLYIPACAALTVLTSALKAHRSFILDRSDKATDTAVLDALLNHRRPIVIFDEGGIIRWINNSFASVCVEGEEAVGASVAEICGFTAEDVLSPDSEEGYDYHRFGRQWGVKGYRLTLDSRRCIMAFFNDRTEVSSLYMQIQNESPVVCYIMIDNLEELMQYVQEQYRTIAGEVETVLKSWAESVGGIFREYEKERYMFIFEARHLEEFAERRFDILDRVREVRVGDGSMPVTISMGLSGGFGILADKERAAKAALDMALQRGGDQAVIRRGGALEFYGGKSKGVSKRTKVRARVIANALAVAISKSSNVLVMGHAGADFDSLGACVGIARLAIFCGVRVNIIVNDRDPNLARALAMLKATPDLSSVFIGASDAQDTITSETLLVICDVNNREKFESPEIADNVLSTVIIDHHRKTAEYPINPIITYIEPSASSACELVTEILEQSIPTGSLPKEEADMIFAGILLDTRRFTRNTHTRTFSAALYLRGEGADPADTEELFKTDLRDFMSEARFESDVMLYRTAIAVSVASGGGELTALDRVSAAKAADKLLSVDGVEASFVICPLDGYVHISARSAGEINVQLIAEKIGGGGRFDVAATQMTGVTVAEAKQMLLDAIDSYLDEE